MRGTAIQYDTQRLTGCRYCGQEIAMATTPGGRPIAFDAPLHLLPQQIGLLSGTVSPVAYVVSLQHYQTCPVWNNKTRRRKGRR